MRSSEHRSEAEKRSSNVVTRGSQLRFHERDLSVESDRPAAGIVAGVLALQGAYHEHAVAITRLGAERVVEVRTPEHLALVDCLLMPGGESTTMSKLLMSQALFEPLAQRLEGGMPTFGTCAGMILLATTVLDGRADQRQFGVIDLIVRRNGYGRQLDSFEAELVVKGFVDPFPTVFIRAPLVESAGPNVEILSEHDGHPVLCRQGPVLVAAFHPEMTADLRIHRLFVESMVHPA